MVQFILNSKTCCIFELILKLINLKKIQDNSFGIIPLYKNTENVFLFCLVQHAGEHWGFPKGHPDSNETEEETAKRELQEETGIKNCEIITDKSFEQKYIFEKDEIIYDKTVKYFIGIVSDISSEIPENFQHEISEVKWLPYNEARELITYENAKVLIDEVYEYLHR